MAFNMSFMIFMTYLNVYALSLSYFPFIFNWSGEEFAMEKQMSEIGNMDILKITLFFKS